MSDSLSEKIIRLLLEEILQHGKVEPHEKRIIERLFPLLKMPQERFYAIYREVEKKFAGKHSPGLFDFSAFSQALGKLLEESLPPAQAKKNCEAIGNVIRPLLPKPPAPKPVLTPPIVPPAGTGNADAVSPKQAANVNAAPPAVEGPPEIVPAPVSPPPVRETAAVATGNTKSAEPVAGIGERAAGSGGKPKAVPGSTGGVRSPTAATGKKPAIPPESPGHRVPWLLSPFLPVGRIGRIVMLNNLVFLGVGFFFADRWYRRSGIPGCYQGILGCFDSDTTALCLLGFFVYFVGVILAKRLHDLNHSGILALVAVGSLIIRLDILFLLCLVPCVVRGPVDENNTFGPSPN